MENNTRAESGVISLQPTAQALVENISDAVVLLDVDLRIYYINQQVVKLTGFSAEQVRQKRFFDVFPDAVDSPFQDAFRRVKDNGTAETFEASFGQEHTWYWVKVFGLDDKSFGFVFQEVTVRRRLEIIANAQREALSVALSGADNEEVLNILVEAVERQAGHKAAAAISLVSDDESLLELSASPNLPDELASLMCDTLPNAQGPLGVSFVKRNLVTISDMTSEVVWTDFSGAFTSNGYRSFWCVPILSAHNKSVLGVFSVFYSEVSEPIEADLRVVEALSRTAAIIIERKKENLARLRAENALFLNTETLNKQRRLYETALSNTPDLQYIFDLDGRFTYANDALLKMWGKTWQESVGKTCLELGYEPWHAEMHMREIEQVIRTKEPIRGDVPFTGTQGRRIYDYIFVPVIGEDGNVEAIAGSTRDVTERKEAEELAKKAEARRRLALEASHSFGIWEWDIKNNIFTADERLGELFNLSPEEAKEGVSLEVPMQYIHPKDIQRINRAISESIEKGTRYNQEYRIIQKDGSVRWASFRGKVMYDNSGQPDRFPGVGVDITREKEAINALQKADARKDEFLAMLAHELRNPLTPIRNALHILQDDTFSATQKSEAFVLVERQVKQLVRLVDDLMDVSRISRGKIRLNKTPVNICQVIDAAIETVQPLVDECNHQIEIEYPDNDYWINGDLIRLSQIFSNIINNAVKYTPENGLISIKVELKEGRVQVTITDNGIGIPEEEISNIFELFSQVEGVLERSQGGLGIGLTLVKRLTELHDGSISVASNKEVDGTTFTVAFPQIEPVEHVECKHIVPQYKNTKSNGLRVLIVDDNEDAAITMSWILEAKGCDVKVVGDAESALKCVEKFTPDLLFLDIGMPGMNGYDLCIALNKKPSLANAIFVAQTGWGQKSHIKRSKKSGFHHHLVKPVDLADLTPILNEAQQHKAYTKS